MKILSLSLLALLSTQCTSSKDNEIATSDVKNAIPDVGTMIIDLPTAIAPASSGLRLENGDGVKGIFLIPVTYTGVAKSMTTLTKDVVEHIFGKAVCTDSDSSNDLEDCAEYTGIISGEISETATVFEVPGSEGSDSPRYVKYWANPAGSAYDVGIELYFANAEEQFIPVLQMQLSKTGEQQGSGEFTFFPNFDTPGAGVESIVTRFVATDEKKTMDLQAYFTSDDEGPASLGLSVTDEDGIITGSGTAIRPEQTGVEGTFAPFQKNAEYAFVWTLAADTTNNLGVEKLAVVSASAYADSTAYFTSSGVDSVLRNFAIDLLRTDSSNFHCATYGKIIDTALPNNICKTNSAVTDTQVLNGLKTFCTANPSNDICPIAGQASAWANPIYLNAEGYVGHENHNKPSDANYAPLVQALDALTVYTPTAFKALEKPAAPAAVDAVN